MQNSAALVINYIDNLKIWAGRFTTALSCLPAEISPNLSKKSRARFFKSMNLTYRNKTVILISSSHFSAKKLPEMNI